MGVGVSHRSSVLGAGREGDSLRGLRAHDQTCLDQVCYEVGEHGVGAHNNRGVLGAGDQDVCHGWAGTDPMGAFEVAQPCWGVF